MYLAHYNLKHKPFNISPDSRFLWLSEKHKEGLANLKYGVMENKGFLVLTGDIGTGKTTLINSLIRITGIETLIATVPDPDLEVMDFFNLLAEEFDMNRFFSSKGDFLIQFKQFLLESYVSAKTVLIIIDEAQRLNHELLEQIRLLSNIELDNRKLVNIFFVGQTEFNQLIMDPRSRAVRQRISVNYHLEPLSKPETDQYIHHRLKLAGATEEIFRPGAAWRIFNFSRGYPRLINIVCDLALLTGYSKGLKKIDAGLIKECEKELKIPVNLDKPQKKKSDSPQVRFKSDLPAAPLPKPQKQQINVGFGAVFIIFLFLAFVGYQIYGYLTENTTSWNTDDFAPKQNQQLLEKQRETLKAETQEEKKSEVEYLAAKNAPQDKAEINSNAAPSLAIAAPVQEKPDKADNLKSEPADVQLSDLVANHRSIIYFRNNSNELPQKAYETLNNFIQISAQRPGLKITIEGFTDSRGDPVYNKQLSKYRADIVKSYLVGQGISASRIHAVGRGPANPLRSNASSEGRKQNRRVEIKFLDQ